VSLTIIVARSWRLIDQVLAQRAPRRKATLLPAPWVGELMQQRFGCLMVCGSCEWRYRDALRRFAYVRHPEMKATGVACDFCKQAFEQLPMFFAEEKRGAMTTTRAEEARLRQGSAGLPPDLFTAMPRRSA
jgi:hypothetical protein